MPHIHCAARVCLFVFSQLWAPESTECGFQQLHRLHIRGQLQSHMPHWVSIPCLVLYLSISLSLSLSLSLSPSLVFHLCVRVGRGPIQSGVSPGQGRRLIAEPPVPDIIRYWILPASQSRSRPSPYGPRKLGLCARACDTRAGIRPRATPKCLWHLLTLTNVANGEC